MSHLEHHQKNRSHRPTHSSQHGVPPPAGEKQSPPRPFYRLVWWLAVFGIGVIFPLFLFVGGVVRTLVWGGPLPTWWIGPLAVTIEPAFLCMLISFSLYKRSMLLKRGVITTGHVCHARLAWAKHGKVSQHLVVEFWTPTTPRVRYTAEGGLGRGSSLPRGLRYSDIRHTPGAFAPTHAEVTYDPRDPTNAFLRALTRSKGASWVRLFWAVFFALVAGGILWWYCWFWWFHAYA